MYILVCVSSGFDKTLRNQDSKCLLTPYQCCSGSRDLYQSYCLAHSISRTTQRGQGNWQEHR